MDYQKGKIYKIESHLGPKIYVGATTKDRLSQRMASHHNSYNRWKTGKGPKTSAFDLFDEYGKENCKIVLLDLCPCSSKDELNAKEAHYIRMLDCVNKSMPGRTPKQYYEEKKVEIKEQIKHYRSQNKENIKVKQKQYYEDKKEEIKEQMKQYRSENKEKIKERRSLPFKCDCGSCIHVDEKARHQRSKKHLHYLASKTE